MEKKHIQEEKISTNIDIVSIIKSIYSNCYGHLIKGWEVVPIINIETLENIGYSIKIDLDGKNAYDVSVLNDWKKEVGVDNCTVAIKNNKLILNFKIYNKK